MPRRFIHIALALNFMVASIGVSIDKHFCGELLQKVTLLTQTSEACCGGMKKDKKSDCCHNETQTIQLEDDFQKAQFDFKFPTFINHLIAYNPVPVFRFILYEPEQQITFLAYKPPLLFRDIPVLIQSFLI